MMRKIKLDFYESGKGETTIITFPDESVGIIDAFPSASSNGKRPDILSLVQGKTIRFVCLSHPHDDHAKDLVPIIKNSNPEEFWNTVPDSRSFFYALTEENEFKDVLSTNYLNYRKETTKSLVQLFGYARTSKINQMKISDRTKSMNIEGVNLSFLAPSISSLSCYSCGIENAIGENKNRELNFPNANLISSVILLEFGGFIFVHGGDTEAEQWICAHKNWEVEGRKMAGLFKIPHHGAYNGLFPKIQLKKKGVKNYSKMFDMNSKVILFGNSNHPDKEVFNKIQNKTKDIFCLINQFSSKAQNPLGIPGGRIRNKNIPPCNTVVSIEVDESGTIKVLQGKPCKYCDKFTQCLSNAQIPISFSP